MLARQELAGFSAVIGSYVASVALIQLTWLSLVLAACVLQTSLIRYDPRRTKLREKAGIRREMTVIQRDPRESTLLTRITVIYDV